MFQESSISDGKVPVLGVPVVGSEVDLGGTALWGPAQAFSPLPAGARRPASRWRPESGAGVLRVAFHLLKPGF